MRNLSELTLADLVSLYNNYMIVETTNCGYAWQILSEDEFNAVKKEINLRTSKINF